MYVMLSRDKERQLLNRICLLWTKTKEPEITFFVSSQRANQIIGSQMMSGVALLTQAEELSL